MEVKEEPCEEDVSQVIVDDWTVAPDFKLELKDEDEDEPEQETHQDKRRQSPRRAWNPNPTTSELRNEGPTPENLPDQDRRSRRNSKRSAVRKVSENGDDQSGRAASSSLLRKFPKVILRNSAGCVFRSRSRDDGEDGVTPARKNRKMGEVKSKRRRGGRRSSGSKSNSVK